MQIAVMEATFESIIIENGKKLDTWMQHLEFFPIYT